MVYPRLNSLGLGQSHIFGQKHSIMHFSAFLVNHHVAGAEFPQTYYSSLYLLYKTYQMTYLSDV